MNKFKDKINRARDRERCGRVKERLRRYEFDLGTMAEILDEIEVKRDRLDCLKSGMGNPNPTKGGGSSQEDKIVKILDDLRELEEGLGHLRAESKEVREAIRALPDPVMATIVYSVWIYRSESMRSLGEKYNLSHSAIWKKSDVALLFLYKKLFDEALG